MAPEDDDLGVVAFKAGPMTLAKWRKQVDHYVGQITGGFEAEDFADWDFASAFEEGTEPRQAAIDMLAEDVTGHGFLEINKLLGEVST